jgi:hypothetical protein
MRDNADCDVPGVWVVNKQEGIHDGESFASRWSRSEIEMRRFVGWDRGVVLREYGVRGRILGLEATMKVREVQLEWSIWCRWEGEGPAGAGKRKC